MVISPRSSISELRLILMVNSIADLEGYNELCLIIHRNWCYFFISLPIHIPSPTSSWLVVSRFQPLWKIMGFVSWDDDIPMYEMEIIKFHGSSHHQLEIDVLRVEEPDPIGAFLPVMGVPHSSSSCHGWPWWPWEYWTNHTDDWGSKAWLQTPKKRDLVLGYVGYKML